MNGTEPHAVVTIEHPKHLIDMKNHSAALTTFATKDEVERLDWWYIPPGADTLLKSTEVETDGVYAVRAEGMSCSELMNALTKEYPNAIQFGVDEMLTAPEAIDEGDKHTCAAVEYKIVGTDWTEDTLLPLAAAYQTPETASELKTVESPPTRTLPRKLGRARCLGIYHVTIRETQFDSDKLESVKERYQGGRQRMDEKLENIRSSTDTDQNPYAKRFSAIAQAGFVEVDPRLLVYGPDAKDVAEEFTGLFDSISMAGCDVDGEVYTGIYARRSYERAFGSASGLGALIRTRLRSPQCRAPILKRLTRNESSRFIVSEYALPHIVPLTTNTQRNAAKGRGSANTSPAPPNPP